MLPVASDSNSKGRRLLDRIAQKTGLTEEGKLGLLQLINPIVDFDVRHVGFAGNSNESDSVIQVVKRSVTISAPPLGGAPTWDLNLFNTPVNTVATGRHGKMSGQNIMTDNAAAYGTHGPFVCLSAPTGTELSLNNAVRDATVVSTCLTLCPDQTGLTTAAQVNAAYNNGTSAIIGMGFEIHDVTAPLYQQGTATVWRQPQPPILDRSFIQHVVVDSEAAPSVAVGTNPSCAHIMNDVPGKITDMMLLAGTRQWEAKYGAYMVPTLIDSTIPVTVLQPITPVFQKGLYTDITWPGAGGASATQDVNYAIGTPVFVDQIGHTGDVPDVIALSLQVGAPLTKYNNFNSSGIHISGLNPAASLTINTVQYIERWPKSIDTALVPLASRSPSYDPMMMELYSQIMSLMPVGCKVSDNADGDWFFEGLSSLSKFLSPAVASLAGPYGLPISAGLNAISSWSDNKLKERNKDQPAAKKKNPPQKQNPPKKTLPKKQQPKKKLAKGQKPNHDYGY